MKWAMELCTLLDSVKRIAVLGIKTKDHLGEPAYDVPWYLTTVGFDVVPVPVYFPDVKEILGKPVYRRLVDVPGDVDLVNVFRRPKDLAAHESDILARRPRIVWLQQGIRDDAFAERLTLAGITVVQDRCILVQHSLCAAAKLQRG